MPTSYRRTTRPAVRVMVLKSSNVSSAWNWMVREISARPSSTKTNCIFDLKVWGHARTATELQPIPDHVQPLSKLYLTSQLGDLRSVLSLVNDESIPGVYAISGRLDRDVKAVIQSKFRFRSALSEHIAFWVRLATHKKLRDGTKIGCLLPNFQPEDKGPDGLAIVVGTRPSVEIYSVKNSIRNPQPLISSSSFRKKGRAVKYKQLDDFWLCAHENVGLGRLDRALESLSIAMDLSGTQKLRTGLLARCGYNAVIVANHTYGQSTLFDGFDRISPAANKLVATYIGSSNWARVAEQTRLAVKKTLIQSGAW